MSWKPEVVADGSGKWVGNELRFATKEEAIEYLNDLAMRWTSVRDTRIVEVNERVTARYDFSNNDHIWLGEREDVVGDTT